MTIRSPSGTRPGSDLTREPVATMTSVAWRTRSPPLPGRAILAGLSDPDLARALEAASALDPGDLVLVDEGLEPGPHPLHDLVATGGHLARSRSRVRPRASGPCPWRAGPSRRSRPIRAAPSSGCSRGGGTCRRSCPRRRGRLGGRAGRPGRPPSSRRCRRRARRDRSHWRSRRPLVRSLGRAASRARQAAGWAIGSSLRWYAWPRAPRNRWRSISRC